MNMYVHVYRDSMLKVKECLTVDGTTLLKSSGLVMFSSERAESNKKLSLRITEELIDS